jgi:hypothetical protein
VPPRTLSTPSFLWGIASGCRCRDGRAKLVTTATCRKYRRPTLTAPALFADALPLAGTVFRSSAELPTMSPDEPTLRVRKTGRYPDRINERSSALSADGYVVPTLATGDPREVVHWNSEHIDIPPSGALLFPRLQLLATAAQANLPPHPSKWDSTTTGTSERLRFRYQVARLIHFCEATTLTCASQILPRCRRQCDFGRQRLWL